MARLGSGVRKRADGLLEKRFMVDGQRYSVYANTTKELAQKEHESRKMIEAGTYIHNRNVTLDQYFAEWIVGKRAGTKGNTLGTYKNYYYKHISPVLGKKHLQKIERRELLKLQADLSQRLAVSTCNTIFKVVKAVFHDALNDDVISKDSAAGIKALKDTGEKATETFHRALEEWEQVTFMQAMRNDFYYEFAALALVTGMRYGEVAALQWSDIDYKQNVIHITKTITYDEDNRIMVGDSPKNGEQRDIPMNDAVKEILKMKKKKYAMLHGTTIVPFDGRIFSSVYGCLVRDCAVNKSIRNVLKRLEKQGIHIEDFTAHAFRDTFATRYIEQGGSMQTLKVILGHKSLAMTMDLYSHVLPNTKQKEMDNVKIVF